jgi:hypothetical protein
MAKRKPTLLSGSLMKLTLIGLQLRLLTMPTDKTMLSDAVSMALLKQLSLYVLVDIKKKKYMGIITFSLWTIDTNTMMYVPFVFVDQVCRKKKYMLGGKVQQVATYLLRDVAIGVTNEIDKMVPINTMFLTPISPSVRERYYEIGYVDLVGDPDFMLLQI